MDIFDRNVMRGTFSKKKKKKFHENGKSHQMQSHFKTSVLLCVSFQGNCNPNIVNQRSFFHKIELCSTRDMGQVKAWKCPVTSTFAKFLGLYCTSDIFENAFLVMRTLIRECF